MSWSRRRLAAAAAAVAALLLGWWLMRSPAVPVEVAEVSRGALRVTVDEEGETRVRRRFVVASPTAGRLLRIELDEGDPVEVGALVARIEPAPLDPRDEAAARARLQSAEAQKSAAAARVALAEAALAQARRDADRAERLREAGVESAEQMELARLRRTESEQELEAGRYGSDAADHEVEAARAALMAARGASPLAAPAPAPAGECGAIPCVDVRSPVAGHVLRVREESERIVSAGTPLLEVGDPQSLEIVVDVLSADAVRIRPGAEMEVDDWGGERPLAARVRRVEPSGFTKVSALGVEEQRVNVIADFVDGAPSLGDGYRVEARVVVWEAPDVLRVPGSALFRRSDRWHVFTVEGGRARLRAVQVGKRGTFDAEVRSGLEAGERVVLHPSDRIHDGARLRAP